VRMSALLGGHGGVLSLLEGRGVQAAASTSTR
jgi:hypothetical protein